MQYIPEHLHELYMQHKDDFSPPQDLHSELMSYPQEDGVNYSQWISGIGLQSLGGFNGDGKDKYGQPIPFGTGPHSLRCLRKAVEILQPKRLLEIGFNMGYSSSMWLHLSEMSVYAVDISDKLETLHGMKVLRELFPNRFHGVICDSNIHALLPIIEKDGYNDFDTIFIDGGHLEYHVVNDIEVGLKLGIKKFIFDDWWPCWGPGVQPAINKSPVKITHVMGNIALGIVE